MVIELDHRYSVINLIRHVMIKTEAHWIKLVGRHFGILVELATIQEEISSHVHQSHNRLVVSAIDPFTSMRLVLLETKT